MKLVRKYAIPYDDCTVSLAEGEAAVWDVGTTYAIGDQVVREHKVYVSAIDDNLGFDPLLEDQGLVGVRWVYKSHTNAFSFLDGVLSNRVVSAGSFTIEIDNLTGIDTVILFGASGAIVTLTGETSGATQVFEHVVNLQGREVENWWDWVYEPFSSYSDKVVLTGIPAAFSKLTVHVEGVDVELGEILLGDAIDIGGTLVDGTEGEAISHSTIDFNTYGVLTLVKRPVRTEMRYRVAIDADRFKLIKPLMDRRQGTVIGAIGSANRPSTVNMGVLGTIRWSEDLPQHHVFEFTLRGVI